MINELLYQAFKLNSLDPIYGYLIKNGDCYVLIDDAAIIHQINQENIFLNTSKFDKFGQPLNEGDYILLLDGDVAEIKYGCYEMMCPYDDVMMDNIGFYVVSESHPLPMPLGPTEEYATWVGSVALGLNEIHVLRNSL